MTAAFAIGAALPLLVFALAGRRVAERVDVVRRNQRKIRVAGGVAMILLALALVFNVPAALQRAIPDYTSALNDRVATAPEVQEKLNLGGIVTDLQSRVLGEGDRPLPGLFAVGEAAGFGGGGAHGRRALEGTFLGGCILSGRSAAHGIARGRALGEG